MLTDADRAVLDFEGQHWRYAGTKEAAIRVTFGVTPVRHYQRVAALLDQPAAAAYAPATVRRLGGLHDSRGANDVR
ncbi:DUF3263 domain-containing protein [Actinotalea sp. Marseille-Q4924]|uniref:DUF3263 domain-containing protein n=1 Tax=Actinotalea sp. Marseille-Q4924 TaxID=2866571 RepID=UPI001CE43189|nr:DUF3263 domain-containing protein [Actinotalea sp. Marseille-Q4924]